MASLRQIFVILTIVTVGALAAFFVVNSRVNSQSTQKSSDQKLLGAQNVQTGSSNMVPSGNPTPSTMNEQMPPLTQFENEKTYSAVLHTTEGDITIKLDTNTPVASSNFIYLANKDFYNGTIFHRVIKSFMIQGGDPKGDGTGGPGYKFNDEPITGEYKKGTVAMANSGPNTNGSQFFIMHEDYALPKNYVIFGQVTEGLETVDKIAEASVTTSQSGEKSRPVSPIKVNSVEIEVK